MNITLNFSKANFNAFLTAISIIYSGFHWQEIQHHQFEYFRRSAPNWIISNSYFLNFWMFPKRAAQPLAALSLPSSGPTGYQMDSHRRQAWCSRLLIGATSMSLEHLGRINLNHAMASLHWRGRDWRISKLWFHHRLPSSCSEAWEVVILSAAPFASTTFPHHPYYLIRFCCGVGLRQIGAAWLHLKRQFEGLWWLSFVVVSFFFELL